MSGERGSWPPQAEGGGVLAHAQRPPDSGGRAGHHGSRAPRLQVGLVVDSAQFRVGSNRQKWESDSVQKLSLLNKIDSKLSKKDGFIHK